MLIVKSQTLMACLDSHLRSSFLCGTIRETTSCFDWMSQKSRVSNSYSPIFANVSRSIIECKSNCFICALLFSEQYVGLLNKVY